MSIEAINAVRRMEIRPCGRKFIVMALADYADENGSCYPSVKTLADYTCQGEKTVRDHLIALEQMGFLTRERTRNDSGQLGQYRYKINYRRNSPVAEFASGEKPPSPAAKSAGHNHQNSNLTVREPLEGAREPRASRLPENWIIPEAYVAYAESQGMTGEEIGHEADRFRDYWIAQPGAKGRKADWLATWRNWIRGRDRFAPKRTAAQSALANTDRRRNGWREAIADEPGRSGEGFDGPSEPDSGSGGEGQYPRLAYASEATGGGSGY